MAGPYDIGGNWQPLSPNFANFQVLSSAPPNAGTGRSYFDTTKGIGVFASGIWNYASGGGGGVTSFNSRTGVVVPTANDYTFAQLASTPTTAAGYGITAIAWNIITGTPTTISTYGITDGVTLTGAQTLTNKTLTSPIIGTITNTGTLTLPTSTDTLIGKATTDTLTNKTFDTAGAGNSFLIGGVAITTTTGTGANVLATSPALVTPTLGVASATTVNKITITAPATNATLTLAQGSSLVTSGANSITFTSTGATTVTLPTSGTLLTANQSITLSGDISGSGATAITTAIGANKVTLAQMATLAAGKVIGQSGVTTATPVAVSVPILIASGTVSAQANLSINLSTFTTFYTMIELQLISFVPVTDAVDALLRVSVDGTTFDSGAANYGYAGIFGNDGATSVGTGSTSATAITMNGTSSHVGNAVAKPYNAIIKLFNPNVATIQPYVQFFANGFTQTTGTVQFVATGSGSRLTAQVTKGLQFLFSAGNIASGTYRVIGYP